jgi:uncharacterized membrane protein YdjX (TVP38/TMEM64 family)
MLNTKRYNDYRFYAVLLLATAALSMLWWLRAPLADALAWVGDREALTASFDHLGYWGSGVLFLLLVLQVFVAVIPGHALIFAGGYVYGFAASFAITWASTVLGSQIAFLIARKAGRPVVNRLASPVVIGRWDRLAKHQGLVFYLFAFILPIFPSDLMCYVAGLGTISPRRFFIANLLGRMVVAGFITLLGATGLHLPLIFWVIVGSGFCTLCIAWAFYKRTMK